MPRAFRIKHPEMETSRSPQGETIVAQRLSAGEMSEKNSESRRDGTFLMHMTKLETVIQPAKFDAVKDALIEIGVDGMTVTEVRGHGRQKGHTEFYRGREYSVDLLPKIKIEMVLPDPLVDRAVQAITTAARTGKIGDGKIFLTRIDEAIRIRNDDRGENAL